MTTAPIFRPYCHRKVTFAALTAIGFIVLRIATPAVGQPTYSITDLGTLGGGSWGTGINDAGEVVGWYDSPRRGFIWQNGVMRDLGGFGDDTEAWRINNAGQAVGFSGRSMHAFLWQNGMMGGLGGLRHDCG